MAEDRLERQSEESSQRMTRLERFLANISKDVAHNAQQIAQLSHCN